jgi:hypothetical protein
MGSDFPKGVTAPPASPSRAEMKQQSKMGQCYRHRDENLKILGFASYRDYLASFLWQRVREKVFQAKGHNCLLCGRTATQVHHNRYHVNDLSGKTLRYVNPICRPCHEEIEFDGGKKNDLQAAKLKYGEARTVWNNELQHRNRRH